MKTSRFDWDGGDPRGLAQELRALQPPLDEVREAVAEIISAVEAEGDAAVLRYEERFGTRPGSLRVADSELAGAVDEVNPSVAEAIRESARNLARFSGPGELEGESQPQTDPVMPPEPVQTPWWVGGTRGATLARRSVPVASAGAYAPGGRGSYPSTVFMCCVPARRAGVERVAVTSPAAPDGRVDPAVLAAANIAGATEVYAAGGAQAIAALALGTETIEPVDMIVGPGNRYVTEAKRQLVGRVGIDGIAGPSELMVIADDSVDPGLIGLDLCAQAEHGEDGLLVACAAQDAVVEEIERRVTDLSAERPSVRDAPLALVRVPTTQAAVELANALAPEHLELLSGDADDLAKGVFYAGCVFIGRNGGTAFGDYAAGSNHVLPTGGAGRFQGPLGVGAFRRLVTTVLVNDEGARELAPLVATLAEAEGFPVHGESAVARTEADREPPTDDVTEDD
jgi:histidinol dehydrogenase